jgi:phosphatidylglycerophosphate synthase
MTNEGPLRLETWTRANAISLLGASLVAAWVGRPWPLAVVAVGSFAALLVHARGRFTACGAFGLPNALTLLRLIVALLLTVVFHGAPGLLWGALVLGLLALDGVDGAVARRNGTMSEFGALFDMESDALTVLIVVFELWQRGAVGAWILIAGLLRYLYVVCCALLPPAAGEMPRSLLARYAFFVLMVGLATGLAVPPPLGVAGALVGTVAVTLSFARSFYFSYGARSSRGAPARSSRAASLQARGGRA